MAEAASFKWLSLPCHHVSLYASEFPFVYMYKNFHMQVLMEKKIEKTFVLSQLKVVLSSNGLYGIFSHFALSSNF